MKAPLEDPAEPVDADEDAPRAPAGTWASDGDAASEPPRPDESSDRLVRPSRPPPRMDVSSPAIPPPPALPFPLPAMERSATSSASPTSTQPGIPRPPFLASVLMRKRDEHREPIYLKRGRVLAVLGGAAAASAAFASGATDLLAASFGAITVMLALSAFVPVPESRRPLLVMALGGTALVLGTWLRQSPSGAAALVTVLAMSAGLVLRSKRSRSWSARFLVAAGLLCAVSWLVAMGASQMIAQRFTITDLVTPALMLSMVVGIALALLGFVDENGPSGAGYFAIAILGWGALEAIGALWMQAALTLPIAGALGAALVVPATAIAVAQSLGGHLAPPARTRGDG